MLTDVSLYSYLFTFVISIFIFFFLNMIDNLSLCNSLRQSEKQRKDWLRWAAYFLRGYLFFNFSDFPICNDVMQGFKKIEEIFAQERKVVDDLLNIAKVIFIFNTWHEIRVCFVLLFLCTRTRTFCKYNISLYNVGGVWIFIFFFNNLPPEHPYHLADCW